VSNVYLSVVSCHEGARMLELVDISELQTIFVSIEQMKTNYQNTRSSQGPEVRTI